MMERGAGSKGSADANRRTADVFEATGNELMVKNIISWQRLLWSWALIGVPVTCGLVANLQVAGFFNSSLSPLAMNAPPVVAVLSGLAAAHFAVHADAGWLRRSVYYIAYAGGMSFLCVMIDGSVLMGTQTYDVLLVWVVGGGSRLVRGIAARAGRKQVGRSAMREEVEKFRRRWNRRTERVDLW
jgi:hypothetical protein